MLERTFQAASVGAKIRSADARDHNQGIGDWLRTFFPGIEKSCSNGLPNLSKKERGIFSCTRTKR